MSRDRSKESAVAAAFRHYGTSIFTEMTVLCDRTGAVNLSQGFPDFDGPKVVLEAAAKAILEGPNQYVSSIGIPDLRTAIANKMERFYNVSVDPNTQVTVTAGATEALAATLLGLLNPGDNVVVFEPCYDLYPPIISRAGARVIHVPLIRPSFELDKDELERVFRQGVKAIVINNPLNPTGKVFSEEELTFLKDQCVKHDVIAIGDEVYEHLVYKDRKHTPLLAIPGFEEHSVVISSTAKTFSMTGWKVGYAVSSPRLSDALRMSHQFLTFCTPGALQRAMSVAINLSDDYYDGLLSSYVAKRKKLCAAFESLGLAVLWPEGTYYATVDITDLDFEDDLAFCRFLAEEVGVGAVPESYFFKDRRDGKELVRFCFCKTDKTLDEAVSRLSRWRI